jgi:hypothetical protein
MQAPGEVRAVGGAPASLAADVAAAMSVTPAWDESHSSLTLALPPHLTASCTGVLISLGGVLLPADVSRNLRLEALPCGRQHAIKGHGTRLMEVMLGRAQLEACSVIPGAGGQWQLVVCGTWPQAPHGQKVRVKATEQL